jgi:hypothetical protein
LSNALRQIMKESDLKQGLRLAGKVRTWKKVKENIINIITRKPRLVEISEKIIELPDKKEVSRLRREFTTDSLGASEVLHLLEGVNKTDKLTDIVNKITKNILNENRTVSEIIYEGINKGNSLELEYKQKTHDIWSKSVRESGVPLPGNKILDDINRFVGKLKGETVQGNILDWSAHFHKSRKTVPEVTIELEKDRSLTITKGERIAIEMHARNPQTATLLTHKDGGFVPANDETAKPTVLTDNDIKLIRESLTKEEKALCDGFFTEYYKFAQGRINETSRSLHGFNLAEEMFYFPRSAPSAHLQKHYLSKGYTPGNIGEFIRATLEGTGYLKSRTDKAHPIVLEDAFIATFRHSKVISAYTGKAEALRNAKMIIDDIDFQREVKDRYGEHYLDNLKDFVRGEEYQSIDMTNMDKITGDFVSNFDVFALGANPFVMAKQPISLVLAATEMEGKYIKSAMLVGRNEINRAKRAMWNVPELRDRLEGNVSREVGEMGNIGMIKKFFTGVDTLQSKTMTGIRAMDLEAVSRIWIAVEKEVKDKFPDIKGEQYKQVVAARATQVINATQPTYLNKDRSPVVRRQHVGWRLMTRYTGQRNKNFRIMYRGMGEYLRSERTDEDKQLLLKNFVVPMIASTMMVAAVNETRKRLFGKVDEDDANTVGTVKRMAIDTLMTGLGNFYYVGDISNAVGSSLEMGRYSGFDVTNPAYQFINSGVDLTAGIMRMFGYMKTKEVYKSGTKKGEEKWVSEMYRVMWDFGDVFGMKYGIPYKTMAKIVDRLYKMPGSMGESKYKELDRLLNNLEDSDSKKDYSELERLLDNLE